MESNERKADEEHDLDAMNSSHDISPEAMLEFKMETADVQEDPLSLVDQCLASEALTPKLTKVDRYSCDLCNYAFSSTTKKIPYYCDQCKFVFLNTSNC